MLPSASQLPVRLRQASNEVKNGESSNSSRGMGHRDVDMCMLQSMAAFIPDSNDFVDD